MCGEKGTEAIKNPREKKIYISILIDGVFLFKGNIVKVSIFVEKKNGSCSLKKMYSDEKKMSRKLKSL